LAWSLDWAFLEGRSGGNILSIDSGIGIKTNVPMSTNGRHNGLVCRITQPAGASTWQSPAEEPIPEQTLKVLIVCFVF